MMDALNSPMAQVRGARSLLTKLNFPREALLVAGIYKQLFHTSIKIALLLGALVVVGIKPGWSLLLFPLGVVSLILVGTAIGVLVTPLGMLYNDVGRVVPMAMGFLMYLTPVIFPIPKDGWVAALYKLNPFTPLIDTSRGWLTGTAPEMLGYYVGVNVVAAGVLLVVWAAWRLSMPIIIERMNA